MSTTTAQTSTLNSENVLRLVPEVDTGLARAHQRRDSSHSDLEGYDEEQIKLMDEVCIVLDENDRPIGSASKKVCAYKFTLRESQTARQSLASDSNGTWPD